MLIPHFVTLVFYCMHMHRMTGRCRLANFPANCYWDLDEFLRLITKGKPQPTVTDL